MRLAILVLSGSEGAAAHLRRKSQRIAQSPTDLETAAQSSAIRLKLKARRVRPRSGVSGSFSYPGEFPPEVDQLKSANSGEQSCRAFGNRSEWRQPPAHRERLLPFPVRAGPAGSALAPPPWRKWRESS